MTTSEAECDKRNTSRERIVPDHAMRRMHKEAAQARGKLENEGWGCVLNQNEAEFILASRAPGLSASSAWDF
jgi:predicted kinase